MADLKRFNGNPAFTAETISDGDVIPFQHDPNGTNDVDGKITVSNLKTKLTEDVTPISTLDTTSAHPVNSSAVNGALADYSRATMTDYNLNNYLTEGNYCCIGNDTNYTNCPSGYNSNFSLEVKKVMSNDVKYVIQIFRPYGDTKQYQRANYYDGSDVPPFTAWQEVATQSDLAEYQVKIQNKTFNGTTDAVGNLNVGQNMKAIGVYFDNGVGGYVYNRNGVVWLHAVGWDGSAYSNQTVSGTVYYFS